MQLYKQNPLKKILIFTIYQNYRAYIGFKVNISMKVQFFSWLNMSFILVVTACYSNGLLFRKFVNPKIEKCL